jgi:DNA-binding HxlR family transcriptional regulator
MRAVRETGEVRTYGQYCPIARGAEVIAERWTPIILRNLLLGCRTFNDLSDGAPRLSRALLTKRLRELERAGLLTIQPKAAGRGSIYEPTQAGREAWDVLAALGTWGDRWTDVLPDHADPNAVLWSWCHNYQNAELLPDERTVVQFDFQDEKRRWIHEWFHIEDGTIELCLFDPGFGVDLVVRIEQPLAFAQWHLGLLEWRDVLGNGVTLTGPRQLQRALPTWNACPAFHRSRRQAEAHTAALA